MGSKKWHLSQEVLDFDHLINTRVSGKVHHSMPTHVRWVLGEDNKGHQKMFKEGHRKSTSEGQ